MYNPFKKTQQIQQNPQPRPRQRSNDCKIRIKNQGNVKTISFSGNCSPEKIRMAKEMNGADRVEEE